MLNTKKTALFLKSGSVLPVAPANFLEVEEEVLISPDIPIEEFKRINSLLGSNDSYANTDFIKFSRSVSTKMRFQDSSGLALDTLPEYSELLKLGGFDETVDTTPGEETVTYTNSQTPTVGSLVAYIDGYKHEAAGSVAADVTFNFPIGKAATISASLSGYLDNKGIAIAEATPAVTLNPESVLLVGKADIMTAGGVALTPDNITIAMGADIQEFQGMGLAEFQMQDYKIMVTADFFPSNGSYNTAATKLGADTVEALVIKLGTTAGTLVNGKSIQIDCGFGKASTFSDTTENSSVKRSFSWLLQSENQISIKHGFFA